jgi:glycerol-3-phosphate cytidylyltransferase
MIITEADLPAIAARHKGQRVVLAGGAYDLLHTGHLDHLESCRARGDVLVVMLANDLELARRKGTGRPIISQDRRARLIDALKVVDYTLIRTKTAVNGSEEGMAEIACTLQPDMFVLYRETPPAVLTAIKKKIGKIPLVLDDQPRADSTTDIVQRILSSS